MSRKPLAALGIAAAATTGITTGITFASGNAASAALDPGVAPTTHHVAITPLLVPAVSGAKATTPAPAAKPVVKTTAAVRPARPKTYTAVAGDCLWSIGKRFDVSMYAMAAANHMRLTDILAIGRVLNIPPAGTIVLPSAVSAPAPARHTWTSERSSAPVHSTWHSTTSTWHAPVSSGSVTAGGSLEQCIIARESGGNANAWNASGHWGLYQFSASTWAAYGGSPSAFGTASAAVQQQVFNNAIAAGGASNWTPYDGC